MSRGAEEEEGSPECPGGQMTRVPRTSSLPTEPLPPPKWDKIEMAFDFLLVFWGKKKKCNGNREISRKREELQEDSE